jgi:hypothetical protein
MKLRSLLLIFVSLLQIVGGAPDAVRFRGGRGAGPAGPSLLQELERGEASGGHSRLHEGRHRALRIVQHPSLPGRDLRFDLQDPGPEGLHVHRGPRQLMQRRHAAVPVLERTAAVAGAGPPPLIRLAERKGVRAGRPRGSLQHLVQ